MNINSISIVKEIINLKITKYCANVMFVMILGSKITLMIKALCKLILLSVIDFNI